jgi:hypothetical protein
VETLVKADQLAEEGVRLKAIERLAACHFYLQNPQAARRQVRALLTVEPDRVFSKLDYPEAFIRFVAEEKAYLVELGVLGKKPESHGGNELTPRTVLIRTERYRDAPIIAYLMPFGVGQFANREPGKGGVVLASQLVGIGLSIGTFIAIKAWEGGDGRLPNDAKTQATTSSLYILHWVGWGIFGASYAYGVVDGLVLRSTEPEILEEPVPPPKTPLGLQVGHRPGGVEVWLEGRF